MTAFSIADWVMRPRYGVAHLIESIVAGDAVVKCGRRLSDEPTSGGVLQRAPFGTRKCRSCVWSRLEAEPGFNEELRQARIDLESGHGTPLAAIQRSSEEAS